MANMWKNLWLIIKFKLTGRANVRDFREVGDPDDTLSFQRAIDFAFKHRRDIRDRP